MRGRAMVEKFKRILAKEEYCMGCRLCEVHCVVQHSKSKNILKVFKGEEPRPVSGICFEERGPTSFALQCRHCEDAPCIEACISGAMYRDPVTSKILNNRSKCVGCWMCIMVCPYGVIKPDHEEKKVASKCDLCIDAGFPACVEHCPNEALVLVDYMGKKVSKEGLTDGK
ncbi:MAG: 4Fe-4S dicluster domain-containing protein [Synergistetes bacterium]|nr:4Fe-4S dicluster domain-containing protein [Synergistota bacterium]MCX8128009.1 4Fe-4S dicluster domain-containing protein [Synergistota bacterium]MDW8192796.1 4Fe-4S dicluster domain-containing protein [Synergistota bacterium]